LLKKNKNFEGVEMDDENATTKNKFAMKTSSVSEMNKAMKIALLHLFQLFASK
jgi:hypothetical protein